MINRIRVFYNPRDPSHEEIKKMLGQTGINYTMLPTSGPYTLHLIEETNVGLALGPTSVKGSLALLIGAN